MVKDAWLPIGYKLNENILTGLVKYDCDEFQIIKVQNFSDIVLLARKTIADYWISLGLMNTEDIEWVNFAGNSYAFLVSDEYRILGPLSLCKRPESLSEIAAFAAALRRTREKGLTASLADCIYCEKMSLLLPIWETGENTSDDILIGKFATGGVPISINSERRMKSFLPWLDQNDINQICKEAGYKTNIIEQQKEKIDTEYASSKVKAPFELVGRQNLELFFREHIIDIIENPEQYSALGIDFPSAVILHGPPGCGKTYAVDKLVEYIDWPIFSIDSSSIGSPYIHETGRKIAELFSKAMENAPSIVVIDEMESYLSDREAGSGSSSHRVEEVAEFLRKIPEAIKHHVIVVGMTNRIEMIDPAILRRGRFDHVIEVPMASEEEVASLLSKLLSELPCSNDLDIKRVTKKLSGRPLSDVSFTVREASRLTAKSGYKTIKNDFLIAAVDAATSRDKSQNKRKIGFYQDEPAQ